jgi:signal transduction histidine kinase
MKGVGYAATFRAGEPMEVGTSGAGEAGRWLREVYALVNIPGAIWHVSVDVGDAVSAALSQGENIHSRFRRTFLWISATSVLAGLCIIGLIWQADRLARQRQRFSAAAAHELRTPLAGLRVYGDMLADGLGDPARQHEYARHVSAEAERLGRVVSNVLGYTRLERGTMKVSAQFGDLGAAVRECVGHFEPALEAAGATVEVDIADDLPPVRFDRDAIVHILQNLLDNAEKYTRSADDRSIHVALARSADGQSVELKVGDHGPGVAHGERRKLFRPFMRVEDGETPPGLGLGLTMVRSLVEQHGGVVGYADAPGGGAVFTVRLPFGS